MLTKIGFIRALNLALAIVMSTVHKDLSKNGTPYQKFLQEIAFIGLTAKSMKEVEERLADVIFYVRPISNVVLARFIWKTRLTSEESIKVDVEVDETEAEEGSDEGSDNLSPDPEIQQKTPAKRKSRAKPKKED
jgi:hypothetical protein